MPTPLPLNPALAQLPTYQPGRPIEEVARELGLRAADIIKVASNENPLGPSRLAVAAMKKALAQSNLYPDGNAFYLKQKLAAKLGVGPENLILGNGSNEIIEFIGHTLLSPEAEVVVSQYCFAVYPIVTALFGAKLVTVPATNFGHDLDAMLAAITPRTRVVFVANPNNPTGTLVASERLEAFVRRVPERVIIVIDEAYNEYLHANLRSPTVAWLKRHPNLVITRTFSKAYGLAGLRVGYALAHASVADVMNRVRQPFNVNGVALSAAVAALNDMEFVARSYAENLKGMRQLEEGARSLGLDYIPSYGNFLSIRVGKAPEVFKRLLRRGVIVRPVSGYGLPEHLRVTVGTAAENEKFLAALAASMRE